MKSNIRTAKTKSGKTVVLEVLTEVEDGWTSWIIGAKGWAVLAFIPKN